MANDDAPAPGGQAQPAVAEYPPYILVFKGSSDDIQVIIKGPHTESLVIGNPEITIKLEVSHSTPSDGPNLLIKISRE